ncbi:MAG: hypothetical protein JF888_11230 [Candidatus Dormibacteraeota bacterium]|uniref:SpoVT-AbrB domain-containing protein n=1 Tax=Candidatus Dormiibacter inghamiae TaxID=3127013 RepID=A0A934KAT7_9BACT|nr:hypothetical protein [Candidatus Dormibacteraeota bacterium]MBJ7607230.1 hypothetical protein [Candidatus Dormibacteraeota bacterium]
MKSIVAMNTTGRLTLPAETRRGLGLEGECYFEVKVVDGTILLCPVKIVPLVSSSAAPASSARIGGGAPRAAG